MMRRPSYRTVGKVAYALIAFLIALVAYEGWSHYRQTTLLAARDPWLGLRDNADIRTLQITGSPSKLVETIHYRPGTNEVASASIAFSLPDDTGKVTATTRREEVPSLLVELDGTTRLQLQVQATPQTTKPFSTLVLTPQQSLTTRVTYFDYDGDSRLDGYSESKADLPTSCFIAVDDAYLPVAELPHVEEGTWTALSANGMTVYRFETGSWQTTAN